MNIRKKIKTEASKQGLSVYKLAKLSGLQVTQLGKYLKGESDIGSDNASKLLKVLGIALCCE